MWREQNPLQACYNNLKSNAKRRSIPFTLTLEQFATFCYKTDYLKGKGRKSASYSIDRIDNDKGYTLDNIQVLPLGENSRKGNKILHYDWQTRYATVVHNKSEVLEDVDNYF